MSCVLFSVWMSLQCVCWGSDNYVQILLIKKTHQIKSSLYYPAILFLWTTIKYLWLSTHQIKYLWVSDIHTSQNWVLASVYYSRLTELSTFECLSFKCHKIQYFWVLIIHASHNILIGRIFDLKMEQSGHIHFWKKLNTWK